MIPKRYEPVVFGFLLSGFMSLIVTAIATFLNLGPVAGFLAEWLLHAWPASWLVAFPVVLIVAPLVRRLVQLLVAA